MDYKKELKEIQEEWFNNSAKIRSHAEKLIIVHSYMLKKGTLNKRDYNSSIKEFVQKRDSRLSNSQNQYEAQLHNLEKKYEKFKLEEKEKDKQKESNIEKIPDKPKKIIESYIYYDSTYAYMAVPNNDDIPEEILSHTQGVLKSKIAGNVKFKAEEIKEDENYKIFKIYSDSNSSKITARSIINKFNDKNIYPRGLSKNIESIVKLKNPPK
jgi:hypothetical protein